MVDVREKINFEKSMYPAQVKENQFHLPRKLQQMIDGGESEYVDFKKEVTSVNKIAKTIVSFANHKGGRILVGVNDNKTIYGINSEEEKHMLTHASESYCKPSLAIEIIEHPFRKKSILEAIIPNGENKPYFSKGEDEKWWVYIRVKDQSLLASKVMIDVLKREQKQQQTIIKYSTKEQALLDYLGSHNLITIKEYCRLLNISRRRATIILVNLISIGIIRVISTEKEDFYALN